MVDFLYLNRSYYKGFNVNFDSIFPLERHKRKFIFSSFNSYLFLGIVGVNHFQNSTEIIEELFPFFGNGIRRTSYFGDKHQLIIKDTLINFYINYLERDDFLVVTPINQKRNDII